MGTVVSYLFPKDVLSPAGATRRNTKAIGDLSELEVALALARAGYIVSRPMGDSHRYDFVIDDGVELQRIQVKTGRLRNGAITLRCSSSHTHRRSGPSSTQPYFGQVDMIAVFCPDNGKVYLVPESEFVRTFGHLRVDPPRNKQRRNIRWAEQFELA